MRILSICLVSLFIFLVSGCNSVHKSLVDTGYERASSTIKPLAVPKDLQVEDMEDYYPVPTMNKSLSADDEPLIPSVDND